MASFKAACVRALAERRAALILLHIFSIGFRSGEYGGRNRTLAPACSIRPMVSRCLCGERLSATTTSPGLRVGINTALHKGSEDVRVGGVLNRHAGGGSVQANRANHCGGAPMPGRGAVMDAFAARSAAPQPGH